MEDIEKDIVEINGKRVGKTNLFKRLINLYRLDHV